ncbi:MAG: manganese efflux pump MntP family protein [Bulleidia sp.]
MNWDLLFLTNSIALGVGLAMDAFSVSLANGLHQPDMKKTRMCLIAGIFALFQFAMPMIGWVAVHTVVQYFTAVSAAIPWIALALLGYIGGKMLWEGLHPEDDEQEHAKELTFNLLIVQGVATSIDALSVGFTIAEYVLPQAFVSCAIIGIVTFFICMAGLLIGKRFGTKLANKAGILGGVILIVIGLEIFISGVFL